jgi:hypothetical protein
MNDRQLSAGDVVDLPLSFDKAGAWLALQAGIWYNPQVLSIEAIVPGNLEGMDAQAFVSPEPGLLNLVWFATRAQQVQAGTVIGTLRVRVHQSAVLSSVLGLTQRTLETPRHLQAEAYDAAEKVSNLALMFRSQAVAADVISPAQPNPTTGVAHVPIYLERASTVQFNVTDMQGKVVLHQQMTLPAGTHQLTIPAEQLREPGLYFWQVNTETTRGNGKLIRL